MTKKTPVKMEEPGEIVGATVPMCQADVPL